MAEYGFTPGPWAVGVSVDNGIHCVDGRDSEGGLVEICEVWGLRNDKAEEAESVANARLIAASPTLLEALIRAADEIEDLRKYANNHGGMIDNERCDYARAAITLATGEA